MLWQSSCDKAIAAAIEQQSAATDEISRNVQQASDRTQRAAKMAVSVQSANQQSGATSETVMGQVEALASHAHALSDNVDAYLAN